MNDLLSVVSVDVLALAYNPETQQLRLAVPVRSADPFLGRQALPGVVLGSGERLADAAARALAKFTDASPVVLGQIRTFDEPARDPRGPSLSIAMYAVMPQLDQATSVDVSAPLPDLAFDHTQIVKTCLPLLGDKMWRDLGFTKALLPDEFATVDARAIEHALTGEEPHMGNLNRAIDSIAGVQKVGASVRGRGRPTTLRSIDF
jgi:8-oxo-dGTP diphosphatase